MLHWASFLDLVNSGYYVDINKSSVKTYCIYNSCTCELV